MRYDNAQGFVIFEGGAPYQVMRRLYDVRKTVLGYDGKEYNCAEDCAVYAKRQREDLAVLLGD